MQKENIVYKLIEYHTSSNRRLCNHLKAHLQGDHFTKELNISHGSIRKQMVHIAETDRYWMHDIQVLPVTGLNPDDYPDIESFSPVLDEIESDLLDYVRSLSEEQLQEVPQGLMESREEALTHIANHGTDHRAHILSTLHHLGLPTFEQDFTSFLHTQRKVTKNDVLNLIRLRWQGWEEALKAFPDDMLQTPVVKDWSVKDIAAHITWHDREMLAVIKTRKLSGSEWWNLSTDERNRLIYEQHKDVPLQEVFKQHRGIHRELVREIDKLNDNILNDPGEIKKMLPGYKLWILLEENTWFHYWLHTEDLWQV
jgi:uncharacterized damage-inducible protein DinB